MTEPRYIARQDHPISRKDLDKDTLHVLYKLKDAGYESYLVGGAVRDLLMERRPKDFDIATDARPSDLRRLFRNSRTVGRRFKIVHVFFGPKNIEVATLRSGVEPKDDPDDQYIDDDNMWGDLESDSFRRDFTINALFYDIRDFVVIDHTGGIEDLAARRVRAIGDPMLRFAEDPVRMLRAIKFAARFGFTIEPATLKALGERAPEILKASRFRVTEEVFRILGQVNREAGFRLMADHGLLGVLYPEWLDAIGDEGYAQVCDFLRAVDADAAEDIHYPIEVLATGLFVPLLGEIDPSKDQYHRVSARITEEVRGLGLRMDLPKRMINSVVEMLRGQLYLLFYPHLHKRVRRFVESPWFDPTWRVHLLAFRDLPELAEIQAVWHEARAALRQPVGGTVGGPDKRDVFSFRGKTGGGRHQGHHRGRGLGSDNDDDGAWTEDPVLAGTDE
jgi:poly(A) polymerase